MQGLFQTSSAVKN